MPIRGADRGREKTGAGCREGCHGPRGALRGAGKLHGGGGIDRAGIDRACPARLSVGWGGPERARAAPSDPASGIEAGSAGGKLTTGAARPGSRAPVGVHGRASGRAVPPVEAGMTRTRHGRGERRAERAPRGERRRLEGAGSGKERVEGQGLP